MRYTVGMSNPIERFFTAIIQAFLRIGVELVKGLFGANRQPSSNEPDTEHDDEHAR